MTLHFLAGAVLGGIAGAVFMPSFVYSGRWGFHLLGPIEERELDAKPGQYHPRFALRLIMAVVVSSSTVLVLIIAALALLPAGAARRAFSPWFIVGLLVFGLSNRVHQWRVRNRDHAA
jgi:4-hydroxybenzoate polyprenyltransferase